MYHSFPRRMCLRLLHVGNQDEILGVLIQGNSSLVQRCASLFSNMSLPEEQNTPEETSSPIARTHLGLAVSSLTPNPKKDNGGSDRFIDKELFVNERKPSSMIVPYAMFTPKTHLNNGEHKLIPVTAKMI
jgi:hypothetical protein